MKKKMTNKFFGIPIKGCLFEVLTKKELRKAGREAAEALKRMK